MRHVSFSAIERAVGVSRQGQSRAERRHVRLKARNDPKDWCSPTWAAEMEKCCWLKPRLVASIEYPWNGRVRIICATRYSRV